MYKSQINEINLSLKHTKKAIITIGCSFAQGQGAINQELYDNHTWEYTEGRPLSIQTTPKQSKKILKAYDSVFESGGVLDFSLMEYDNSYVSVLCNKFFEKEYTPINLGLRGCGNRGSIKELYMYPEIDWHLMKEIIVIYLPSGLERFDFINDEAIDHFNWKCMWPNSNPNNQLPVSNLWKGYGDTVYSDKFSVLEQIAHVQELETWCKYKKAKLIVTTGFDRRYDKDFFYNSLTTHIDRDHEQIIQTEKTPLLRGFSKHPSDKSHLIDLFPWDKMFEPNGYKTFADLAISMEDTLEDTTDHYFQFLGNGSPNNWITKCSHPSQKSHELFANHLYKHIVSL